MSRVVRAVTAPLMVMLALPTVISVPAAASPPTDVIVLPGASSAEGIAAGRGTTFYAGDLFSGDVFHGDIQRGVAEVFIDAPDGRMAVGMAVNRARGLLFVAGGFTGQAYVYDAGTGATVAVYQLADPADTVINDVAVTASGAWFTDSRQAELFFVPVSPPGSRGRPAR